MFQFVYKKYYQPVYSTFYSAVKQSQLTLTVIFILLVTGCSSVRIGDESTQGNSQSTASLATISKEDFVFDFDSYVLRTMKERHVPGLAVGIVKDGRVWFAKGFGTLEVDGRRPVTTHTIFSIGSLTKGFTSTLAGVMARAGKITYDEPLKKVTLDFAATEPLKFKSASFRDLLAHRSGLPSLHNLFLYGNDLSAQKIFVGISALKPVSQCGREFHYSNEGYTVVGQALIKANGDNTNQKVEQTFQSLLTTKVLNELGLKHTSFFQPVPPEGGDVAVPHVLNKPRTAAVATQPVDIKNQLAAAGLYSNVDDLCEWLKFHLPEGSIGRSQLLSWNEIDELHKAVLSTDESTAIEKNGEDKNVINAAMGWFVTSSHKCRMVFNQGDLVGMKCLATLVPEKELGIVILSNLSENNEVLVVQHKILDFFCGPEEAEPLWINELGQADARDSHKRDEAFAHQKKEINPNVELGEKMVGHYHSDALGDINIALRNGRPVLKYGHRLVSNLVCSDGGAEKSHTFKVYFDYPTVWPATIQFEQLPESTKQRFDVLVVDNLGRFTRI